MYIVLTYLVFILVYDVSRRMKTHKQLYDERPHICKSGTGLMMGWVRFLVKLLALHQAA